MQSATSGQDLERGQICSAEECSKRGVYLCPPCRKVSYCSQACQKSHWTIHRNECVYYRITCDEADQNGLNVVSSRKLAAGTLILEESAFVVSPKFVSEGSPVCLSCCSVMETEDFNRTCNRCGWPVCSIQCETNKIHTENECKFFSQKDIICPEILCFNDFLKIFIVRLSLKRLKHPDIWMKAVQWLEKKCASSTETMSIDLDMARKEINDLRCQNLCNASDWITMKKMISFNSFSYTDCINGCSKSLSLFYLKSCVFSHSCSPNCFFCVSSPPNYTVRIRTSVDVNLGEILTLCYHPDTLLLGNFARIDHFRCRMFPDCNCKRCSDPAELGSFMSTIACPDCDKPSLTPCASSSSASWVCNEASCGHVVAKQELEQLRSSYEDHILKNLGKFSRSLGCDGEENVLRQLEMLNQNTEKRLHKNHWLLLKIMQNFLSHLKDSPDFCLKANSSETPNQIAIRFLKHILCVFDLVCPGVSKEKAMFQLELAERNLRQSELDFNQGSISREEFGTLLDQTDTLLKESLKFFVSDNYGSSSSSRLPSARETHNEMVQKAIFQRVKLNNLRAQLQHSYSN